MYKDIKANIQQDDVPQTQPSVSLNKNEDILKHKIPSILKSYESLKEWSDLGQWQLKLVQVLQEHPCGYLPKKKLFCKRLAQCLSPVWNKAIHENALQIYDIVLHNLTTYKDPRKANYSLIEDLPLFSLGLLPFFSYSSQQCKPKVLEIFQKYYYPLGPQLIPVMGGLISSIIVGMEETNEEQMKKVLNLVFNLISLCDCVGVKAFYGALWMCIVRSSKPRLGTFKFLMKKWGKFNKEIIDQDKSTEKQVDKQSIIEEKDQSNEKKEDQKLMQESLSKILEDQERMPNKSALVMNALLASLEDDSSLIKRGALDFLSSHCRIEDGIFSQTEYLVLVQSCLLLLIKMDHAVVRRINNWFFGEMDLNDVEKLRNNQIISLIQKALNRILIDGELRISGDQEQDEIQQTQSPLKIIQNLYMQHPETVDLTLESIGYQLVKYMFQNASDPIIQKASERLVESIASHSELILDSLYKIMLQRIIEFKVDLLIEIVRLIDYSFNVLMKNHFGIENIIKDESEYETFKSRTYSIQKLVMLVLQQLILITPDQLYNNQVSEGILQLLHQSLIRFHGRVDQIVLYQKSIDSQQQINEVDYQEEPKKYLQTIQDYSQYYIIQNQYIIYNQDAIADRAIFQLLSSMLINLQIYILKHLEVNYNQLPNWVHQLMASTQCASPLIAINSIETLVEINKQAESNPNCYTLSQLLTHNAHIAIQPLNEPQILQQQEENYMLIVFQRLWSLLDYHYQDSKVINLILYFSKTFPFLFTYVIESSLLLTDETELENMVRRYQIFCRLTNPHFRKFSHENKGVGVLIMLSYLQHENPLMRNAAKTWLTETAPFFFRILDPLIEQLITALIQAKSEVIVDGCSVHKNEFNTEIVMDTVRKLDLILANIKEWYMPYLQNAKISKIVQDKLHESPVFQNQNTQDITYLQVILILLDKFIQSKPSKEHNPKFVKENSRLNALCCESFEQLYSNISASEIKAHILINYLGPQLELLKNLIERDVLVMQIQVLNLLKAFILSIKEVDSFIVSDQLFKLQALMSSNLFFQNMVNGLQASKVFLLKSRYLNTIIVSVYCVSEIFSASILTENIALILNTLMQLLRDHAYNQKNVPFQCDNMNEFIQGQQKQQRRISNTDYAKSQYFNNVNKKNSKKAVDFKSVSLDSDELLEKNSMSIITSLSGENFEEIMSISNSIKALIGFFFKFKDEIKDTIEHVRNFQGILVDILTLNLLRNNREKQSVQKVLTQPSFIQYQETSQWILNNMTKMIGSYLQCWHLGPNQQLYQEYFSTKGSIVYEYLKFDNLTQTLKNQLQNMDKEPTDDNQIKSNILSIMSPCAIQFTTEFVSACLDIWTSQCDNSFYEQPRYNTDMYKLVELLIFLQIEPEEFIQGLMKSNYVANIQVYNQKKFSNRKRVNLVCESQAAQENNLLFFVYVYFNTNLSLSMAHSQLVKFWLTTLSFTKILLQTRHINSLCWLLELFYMMSWKYSPKEALHNNDLRKELHSQIRIVLNSLSEICTEKQKFGTVEVDQKQGVVITSPSNSQLKLSLPFTPSIYELYYDYLSTIDKDGEKNEEMRDFYWVQRIIFDPFKQVGEVLNSDDFGRKCSLIAFKTLKRIAYITLINTYEANKGERILDMTKEFMAPLFPLMGNNTVENTLIIVEATSEMVHSLLKNSRDQYPKEFKKQILDIFNKTDFFKCSRRTLKYWKEIIDWASDKGELLADQLGLGGNYNFFIGVAGLFSSRNSETIKKIKGFERVCFIIYSGAVDKYISKINILLDAILDSMKEIKSQHPSITVLIIFCIRILILRLSPQALNNVFRRIWPSLISMLIQIFHRKGKVQANHNVLLAGLKLIELLSLFQLEEFYYYQWIFVFDYFGIIIDIQPNENDGLEQRDRMNQIQSPFDFTPYVAYQFPSIDKFTVSYQNQLFSDQAQIVNAKKKRLVIIKDPFVEDDLEVRRQAVYLCQYLIDINQQRFEISTQQLENLIEAEFIQLDDYIFNIQ